MPVFEPFAPGGAATVALMGARIGGLVLVAPVFSAKVLPRSLKAALVVLLTAALLPAALGHVVPEPRLTPATLLTETLIGFVMGLGAAVLIAAAEMAGDFMAVQMGLSGASMLDPLNSGSVPVLGQFLQLFAVTLVLALDGHLLMLEAVAASLAVIPLGGEVAAEPALLELAGLGSMLFMQGLRFAAPVIAAALVGNVALGILARTVPQLNILMVAFPLQIGLGFVMLGLALPLIAGGFAGWGGLYEGLVGGFLGTLGGR
jgi:flagellar biosynthesis protein FliR